MSSIFLEIFVVIGLLFCIFGQIREWIKDNKKDDLVKDIRLEARRLEQRVKRLERYK